MTERRLTRSVMATMPAHPLLRMLLLRPTLATALVFAAAANAGTAFGSELEATAGPWDVAISRRPYIAETTGELLLQISAELAAGEKPLKITAELPCAGANWNWTVAVSPGTEQYILPFPLGGLPKLLNNDMTITVSGGSPTTTGVAGSKRRRFGRAWKSNSSNTVQVDHSTRGLLVDGQPWALMGWYIYEAKDWEGPRNGPCDSTSQFYPKRGTIEYANRTAECIRYGVGNMTAGVAAMGDRGITAVMPYVSPIRSARCVWARAAHAPASLRWAHPIRTSAGWPSAARH